MDIKNLIESNKSPEAITSGLCQEETAFEKLSLGMIEHTVGESSRYVEVFGQSVDLPLTDPSQFDNRASHVLYGKRKDEKYFVHLKTTKGITYSIGTQRSLKEAEGQAVVLANQKAINLQELKATKVK